ncbi:Probable transcriptional regulatory protein YebC [Buchnera aphidicola (Cinara kochiana kochiana)]|uniref:Probable transcriptional regulatory protein YebC n=1 Tax=Buchnera aphidicola (Cinara kochiana kochiana) TaxID=2518976 RepID=A0A451D5P0_9GAMM|nr:YebC/PmpR family DNA-binding transcriptional regulator [Buchnera aphidicola]VFP81122.1 Probable transcriptional regulatory protein YebC [Buchnera aphidicola (Cinara kochiana kochiana)]
MAGHSKWANTKHRKYAQDVKRSKIFTKIIKEIATSSAKNGSDINQNFQLRNILEKAHSYNLKKKLINNAIQRSSGSNKQYTFKTMKYAGYGPAGTAIVIHCNTDNSNRTVSNIRNIFSQFNARLTKYENIKYLFNFFYILKINININNKNLILDIINKNNLLHNNRINKNFLYINVEIKNLKIIKQYLSSYSIIINNINMLITPKIMQNLDSNNNNKIINMINLLKQLKETIYIVHNGKIY